MLCTRGTPHLRAGAGRIHGVLQTYGYVCSAFFCTMLISCASDHGMVLQNAQTGQEAGKAHRVWDEGSGQGKGTKNTRQYAIRSRRAHSRVHGLSHSVSVGSLCSQQV